MFNKLNFRLKLLGIKSLNLNKAKHVEKLKKSCRQFFSVDPRIQKSLDAKSALLKY